MADMVSTPFGAIPSFIFGGNTGTPSYAELQRRRAIMEARARQARPYAKTLGEGIQALGEGLGQRFENQRLAAAEQQYETAEDARKGGVLDAPGVGAGPARVSDASDPNAVKDRIAAYYAGGPGGAAANPTVAAGASSPQVSTLAAGGLPAEYSAGIAGIESGGGRNPYTILGAVTPSGDRAYGKYQVMGANIPSWTEEAVGQRMTPQQFLASDKAQEAVFQKRFGDYVNKYGPEGAARAWYAGEKGMRNLGATDQHGRLTVQGYGQDFMRRVRGAGGVPSGAPPEDTLDSAGETVTHVPGADDENPVTPSTIRPAPAVVSGAPVIKPAPPAASGGPGSAPSMEPIPPAKAQTMEAPGSEPAPPARIDFSPRQKAALEMMNSRSASDHGKAWAKQQFDIEEKIRTELTARREADYVNKRERWEKKTDEYTKFKREEYDRGIEQITKRLAIETSQVGIQKAMAELEKLIHDSGVPRQQAMEDARLKIEQAKQNLAKPTEHVIGGVVYQRKPGEETYAPAPGSPEKKTELTERQMTMLDRYQRASVVSGQVTDPKKLTELLEVGKGKLPVAGNYWVSDEFRRTENAAHTWMLNMIRNDSGAVIGPHEIPQHYRLYFPVPGDTTDDIARKAVLRRTVERAWYSGLGDDGQKIADKFHAERGTRKVDFSKYPELKEGDSQFNAKTGKTRRVIGGHWEYDD